MDRYVKPDAVTEYEIPITLHWQYARESAASPSTGYNVTPETLINNIYEDIKETCLHMALRMLHISNRYARNQLTQNTCNLHYLKYNMTTKLLS